MPRLCPYVVLNTSDGLSDGVAVCRTTGELAVSGLRLPCDGRSWCELRLNGLRAGVDAEQRFADLLPPRCPFTGVWGPWRDQPQGLQAAGCTVKQTDGQDAGFSKSGLGVGVTLRDLGGDKEPYTLSNDKTWVRLDIDAQ